MTRRMSSETIARIVALGIGLPGYLAVQVCVSGRTFGDACLSLGMLVVLRLLFRLIGAYWKKRRRRKETDGESPHRADQALLDRRP